MRRAMLFGLALLAAAIVAPTALGSNYVVLYKQQAVGADAAASIQKAGGMFVYAYPEIGVVIASSENASFRSNLLKDAQVEEVAASDRFVTQVRSDFGPAGEDAQAGDLPNAPATDSTEPLYSLQWDMQQIHTAQAHAITGGSPAVVVGDIDTGTDYTHPDLAPNIDWADSVSCLGGVPDQSPLAWRDEAGHGTHTAGTILAASNGFGMVGVAPNVKLATIRAGNADGFFFPEAVICAFYWAGTHHVDVTNNSYFADPWLFNCRNDPVQRAIWKAEQRAIMFAQQQGVTVVAAEGNESTDLAHPTFDPISPDDGTPVDRTVTNACVVIPVEIPGVIGVTATGDAQQVDGDADPTDYLKSYYSSYGVGVAELTAPGGDFYYGRSARAANGLVLSTWPSYLAPFCGRRVTVAPPAPGQPGGVYCYLQGTSMASPHVAGVAALVVSRYGDLKSPQNGKMRPEQVAAYLQQTADPQPCPTELPLNGAPGTSRANVPYANSRQLDGSLQSCQGGPGHTSWYGNGRVDAFNAVTRLTGAAANDEP